ncbi:hypothetical protein AGMMS49992_31210 [Clostridia bacterium]|nr:hypothetical protein AGMMS49992_31210 [Clostridia bacterium]
MLERNGWTIVHGSNHDLAINPKFPGMKITIPRHKGDLPIGTAKAILKQAGL